MYKSSKQVNNLITCSLLYNFLVLMLFMVKFSAYALTPVYINRLVGLMGLWFFKVWAKCDPFFSGLTCLQWVFRLLFLETKLHRRKLGMTSMDLIK